MDYFMDTPEGQEKLDGICMQLIAIGESLKNIDKITDKRLLEKYPQVDWKGQRELEILYLITILTLTQKKSTLSVIQNWIHS